MTTTDTLIPGRLEKKESELRASFVEQVSHIPGGEKIKKCIQCGTCSGSCPVSYTMDILPREVIALFRAGDIESILKSRTIWICASCYACTVRCPSGIKVTDILYTLKRMAIEKKLLSNQVPIPALSKSFVSVVNRYGRSHEPELIIRYCLKTDPLKLLRMSGNAVSLWRKGRLKMFPKKIEDRKKFAKILAEAQLMDQIVPLD